MINVVKYRSALHHLSHVRENLSLNFDGPCCDPLDASSNHDPLDAPSTRSILHHFCYGCFHVPL
jgi:hypothetical protein